MLYAPVVKAEDFHSAIAYLVRRLDENTAPENFLHDLFGLIPESAAWRQQEQQFLAAFRKQEAVSDKPRRHQNRAREEPVVALDTPFANEPDTDWSLPANRSWLEAVIARWQEARPEQLPLQIGGELVGGLNLGQGHDPSLP
ncbi:MAG TPA: hypothetical protein PKE45_06580, partial [Caldilineaceae bacterium]|nr:hypothetical protein [Caldilineaceae bacterium]